MQIAIWLCFDELFICLIKCMNLYTFEVNVFKISALKLQKMNKLWILKHTTLISKHPVCSKTNNDNFWLSVDCYWLKLVCELFHWWKGRNLILFIISLDFIITIIFNVIFFINLCIVDISIRKVTWCNLLFELNDLTAFLDLVMGSILTNRQLGNQKCDIQINKRLTGQWSLLLEIARLLDGAFWNYGIIQMNSFWRHMPSLII